MCVGIHKNTEFMVAFPQGFLLEKSLSPGLELLYYEDIFKYNTDSKYWKSNYCEISIIKCQWKRKYFHYHASPLNYNNFLRKLQY